MIRQGSVLHDFRVSIIGHSKNSGIALFFVQILKVEKD
ncbi:hypothetical protein BSPWISOX_2763 [uncultured Gammaproteobacteria bacterium]|nr:hypothetical protein BSPWISOX_2763 [uncultured Gammaproteobacteria bacterium]